MDEQEAKELFGKFYRTTIKAQMKKRGIGKPRLALKDGKIYIWSTKV